VLLNLQGKSQARQGEKDFRIFDERAAGTGNAFRGRVSEQFSLPAG